MSITSPVPRIPRAIAALVLAMGVLVPVTTSWAAPRARSATRPAVTTDPATRIGALGALASRRSVAIDAAVARRDDVARRLAETQSLEAGARDRTDALSATAAAAAARYASSRDRLADLAAAAYRDGPSVTPLSVLLSSRSAADVAYRSELVKRVGDAQRRAVAAAKRDRLVAQNAADAARAERNRLLTLVDSLQRDLPARGAAVDTARASAAAARLWLSRWQAIVAGAATPIRGSAHLSAPEIAAWFSATRRPARASVPIGELARFYVEEGDAAGVRGDIAFAQSVLETAGFRFPDGGQVLPIDNNFAGIGACDSCASGRSYPDPRTGVRAQMQLLRVYADPRLTNAALSPAPVDPRLDQHYLRGKIPTWAGLTHTWATANGYGDRILGLYEEMLGWLTDRARI